MDTLGKPPTPTSGLTLTADQVGALVGGAVVPGTTYDIKLKAGERSESGDVSFDVVSCGESGGEGRDPTEPEPDTTDPGESSEVGEPEYPETEGPANLGFDMETMRKARQAPKAKPGPMTF